jgi:hypothetical protein
MFHWDIGADADRDGIRVIFFCTTVKSCSEKNTTRWPCFNMRKYGTEEREREK